MTMLSLRMYKALHHRQISVLPLTCAGKFQIKNVRGASVFMYLVPPAVPGPCDPEDLIDGIIFAATYLGCTHLLSERTPSKSARMQQAQEAMSRVRVRKTTSGLGVRFRVELGGNVDSVFVCGGRRWS